MSSANATASLAHKTQGGLTPASRESRLIGSVPEVCEKLEQRRSELGVSYVNVAQRSMEAFAPVVARLAGT